jgi:hypothetical protein
MSNMNSSSIHIVEQMEDVMSKTSDKIESNLLQLNIKQMV